VASTYGFELPRVADNRRVGQSRFDIAQLSFKRRYLFEHPAQGSGGPPVNRGARRHQERSGGSLPAAGYPDNRGRASQPGDSPIHRIEHVARRHDHHHPVRILP